MHEFARKMPKIVLWLGLSPGSWNRWGSKKHGRSRRPEAGIMRILRKVRRKERLRGVSK